MKKIMVFLISFLVLYTVLQIGSGLVLTALYVPDIEGAWETSTSLSSEVSFGGGFTYLSLVFLLTAALLAAFVSKIIQKKY
ncbi:hypothetical protein FZC84_08825 [Rossellomorea vietnamensis]|uniref:Uncharacterized protein n=1 Tax=Rossellomorea vietnamensis TaxID=218284 RepID=A0A5D4ME80_9BACI|nr:MULTISPECIES: hypothetical protein [Bacillaceae]TYR99906.1 hypothetical protein FZC84_08825 [Rossellomorea vietnamensis]